MSYRTLKYKRRVPRDKCIDCGKEMLRCNMWGDKTFRCPPCHRIKELEADLKFNTSMLAKQTDLAREAEARVMKLENELAKIKSDPSIGKLEVQDWLETPDY